ncbi:aminotransferase class I/II-fold pyridoxal phosphate-dependent enzyme [Psychrosphaera aestuarii]|uniref:aminotransferase class I/II-fold pyridoxal phosphate-dependent enzyme n=1 Tax=Psychrosphaera aestuarii TaxID=1266052 RepID=UPI001B333555|nr:8-amino-7-oxononanoate synthase [Psychrosphaera aestuarii]
MTAFSNFIAEELKMRDENSLLRSRRAFEYVSSTELVYNGNHYRNYSSNDYLGLASSFCLTEFNKWQDTRLGITGKNCSSGSMASPLVTGFSYQHKALIDDLLNYVDAPDDYSAVLFSSGYAANNGVINALFKDKDSSNQLFQDKLNHASLIDAGTKLQAAGHLTQKRFSHNNVEHLAKLLNSKSGPLQKRLLATEGVFSMDGDRAPLIEISKIARQTNTLLMVDDAHGFGISRHSLHTAGITLSDVDIYVVTFGKSLGAQGAAVIAKDNICQYLENFCKDYIYSTHLSPLQCAAVQFNLHKLNDADRQQKLQQNIQLFRSLAIKNGLPVLDSDTAIQPIMVGDEKHALKMTEQLKQDGIWLTAIRTPTVPKGQSRLRVTITSDHKPNCINDLVESLVKALSSTTTSAVEVSHSD